MIDLLTRYFSYQFPETHPFFVYLYKKRLNRILSSLGISIAIGFLVFIIFSQHPVPLLSIFIITLAFFISYALSIFLCIEIVYKYQIIKYPISIFKIWLLTFQIFVTGYIFFSTIQFYLLKSVTIINFSFYRSNLSWYKAFSFWVLVRIFPVFILIVFLTVYILKKIEQKKDISDTEDVPKTDEPKQLILSTRTQTEIVNMENISHISVEEHYSRIFYQMDGKTEEKLIKIPLKKILTELPDENFIQVHRSHIVNLSFVAKISREKGKGKVTMNSTDNPEIPVSRRKYLEVQEKVASFFNI